MYHEGPLQAAEEVEDGEAAAVRLHPEVREPVPGGRGGIILLMVLRGAGGEPPMKGVRMLFRLRESKGLIETGGMVRERNVGWTHH